MAIAIIVAIAGSLTWLNDRCQPEMPNQPVAYQVTEYAYAPKNDDPDYTNRPVTEFSFSEKSIGGGGEIQRTYTADYSGPYPRKFWDRFVCEINGADYTLAIFTGLLFLSTFLLWSATRSSVKVAERALIELERPFVYAEITNPGIAIRTSDEKNPIIIRLRGCELTLFNFGRTPATLTRLEYRFREIPKGSEPDCINPAIVGGRELPVGTISADRYPFKENTDLSREFIGVSDDIGEGRVRVWIVGFVRYRDIFDRNYITGFTKLYDLMGDRFIARGDQKYNYAHAEDPKDIPGPSARA